MTDPPSDSASRARTTALLVVVGLIWGSAYPVIRYGIVIGATPVAYAASRYALSALAMAGLAAVSRIARPSARSLGLSAVLGLPIVGLYGLLLYVGEATTSGGLSSILVGSAPLLTAAFALPLLPGESLHRWGYVGLLFGFVGVVVLVAPPPGISLATSVWGPIEVVAAAASFAVGSVLLRRLRPGGESLWGVTAQFAVASALLFALLPAIEPRPSLPATAGLAVALAYLVALPSVAGYALYFHLHHRVGPGRANVVAYVNPVAALSIGVLVFGEAFHWWELAGFALIVVGLTLLTQLRRAPTSPGGPGSGGVRPGDP